LFEETGLKGILTGSKIASRTFTMMLPSGETVLADERFFMINVYTKELALSGWSSNEKEVIRAHHWWTIEELIHTNEMIFPRDLIIHILKSQSPASLTLTT